MRPLREWLFISAASAPFFRPIDPWPKTTVFRNRPQSPSRAVRDESSFAAFSSLSRALTARFPGDWISAPYRAASFLLFARSLCPSAGSAEITRCLGDGKDAFGLGNNAQGMASLPSSRSPRDGNVVDSAVRGLPDVINNNSNSNQNDIKTRC